MFAIFILFVLFVLFVCGGWYLGYQIGKWLE